MVGNVDWWDGTSGEAADSVSMAPSLDLRTASGLLALQHLPRIGPTTALRAALHRDLKATNVAAVDESALAAAHEWAETELNRYRRADVDVIAFFDDRYPQALSEISDPPPVLFAKGNVDLLAGPRHVAVVGTREPSVFGETAAKAITARLGEAGWTIVSGLAIGSDALAHQTALEVGAPTIAILGNGLDRVYPKLNEPLARRIVDSGGLLLSELPFEAPPVPRNLIARDRLQSGLATAVVVAQTGVKGGTMHTARFAAEQGRPIFCPAPHGENGKSEGLRVLLERPGRELCEVIPAWKQARSLCARLGTQPVARPVEREQLDLLLDSLELALVRPAERDRQALLFPASIEA
jgi:DNA processing protein